MPFRLIRQTLWLKATDTTVQLFREHELVAVHCRLRGIGRRSTLNEHLPPEALAYKLQDPQWCLKKAEAIGPACLELIQRLFAHRVLDNLRAAQGIIRLGERYGKARLEAACRRAITFDAPRSRTVKIILERGQDQLPADAHAGLPALLRHWPFPARHNNAFALKANFRRSCHEPHARTYPHAQTTAPLRHS